MVWTTHYVEFVGTNEVIIYSKESSYGSKKLLTLTVRPSFFIAGRMLLCVRERSASDIRNHSSLQRQFSSGHGQKIDHSGSGSETRISHFLPTSRRIVQFSNSRVRLYGFSCIEYYPCPLMNIFHNAP